MNCVKALALGLAGAALFSSAASAQALQKSGSIRARVTYDSNVARSDETIADLRDLEQTDVIADILATFDVKRAVGRQQVFARGTVGYDFHRDNPELDRERINVQGGVSRAIGPCSTNVTGGYARSQSDLAELELEATKNTVESTTAGLSVTCARVIGLAPTVSVSRDWVENSADSRQRSNYDSTSVSAGIGYSRPALGTVSIYGSLRETDYPNRLVLVNGEFLQDGYESISAGLRYSREIGARLQGNAFVAYTSLDPEIAGVEGYEGLTYGAALSYRPSSRLSMNLSWDRDTKPSNRLDSTYALSEALTLQATYALGYRISVDFGGSYRRQTIEGALLQPGVDVLKEETEAVFGAVKFKVNQRISLSVDARHEDRNADVSGFDYSSERVGLSATAGF